MLNNTTNYNFLKMKRFTLPFIVLLICSNFIVGMYLRDNLYQVIWNGGDVSYIGIAREFQEHKTFQIPYLTQDQLSSSLNDTIKNYPTPSIEEGGKGPVYLILLGSFFNLLGTTLKNFYFHASLFANITSSAFLIVFFFFVRSKFNEKIAIVSSIVLSFLPYFAWASVRVLPDTGIFLSLSLTAFFFLEKKIKHYLLFGFFVGLSHLTHEFGVLLGMSYAIFLLVNRELKGAMLVFVSWTLTISPWLIRNYYYFRNLGEGLYLPLGTNISKLISYILHTSSTTVSYNLSNSYISHSIRTFTPFQVFIESFRQELVHEYHVSYLIIFFILFSGFAFLSIKKLNFQKFFLLIPVVISYYLVNSYLDNVYIQTIFLFIIPVILIYLFYKKGKSAFMSPMPRTYSFIIWFVFFCLAAFFFTALVFLREVPETRQLVFPIILLIPLSIAGFANVISYILNRKKMNYQLKLEDFVQNKTNSFITDRVNGRYYLIIAIFVLVLSPIIFQEVSGIQFLNYYVLKVFDPESWFNDSLKNWLQTNVHEGVIVSDLPSQIFLMTGLHAVPLPPVTWGQIQFEQYLEHYNATYVVFYDADRFLSSDTYNTIKQWSEWYFSYDEVYTVYGHAHVLKLTNLVNNADISDPVHYIRKADLLQRLGKTQEANKIYTELKDLKPTSMEQLQGLCSAYTIDEKYDDAISRCNQFLFIDKTDMIVIYNLLLSYEKTGQQEKFNDTLVQFDNVVGASSTTSLNQWINFMNKQMKSNNIMSNAYDVDISLEENQYANIIKPYDTIIEVVQSELNRQTDQLKQNMLLQIIIEMLDHRGMKFMSLGDYIDAEKSYLEILRLDQFNENAHAKYAMILEKTNQLQDAINQYEFLSKLEQDNTKTLEKIHELKMKLIIQ